jgi:parvulin-like peptidyl-prolyl isomerase
VQDVGIRWKAIVAGALLLAGAPATAAGEPVLLDGVAAEVNGGVITVGEVMAVLQPLRERLRAEYGGEALVEKLREAYRDALQRLIERQLILDAYERQELTIPEWVVDERVAEITAELFEGDRTRLVTALAEDGMTLEEWRETIREQIIISAMQQANVEEHVRVAPREVRRAYEKQKERFRVEPAVKLGMIVVDKPVDGDDGEPRRRAEGVLRELRGGADFAALARERSDGARAEEGGRWGWVEPGMLHPRIAEAVESLARSEISGVIETEEAYFVVRLDDRRKGGVRPFEEVEPELEEELRRAVRERLHDAWMDRLSRRSYVRIHDVGPFSPASGGSGR